MKLRARRHGRSGSLGHGLVRLCLALLLAVGLGLAATPSQAHEDEPVANAREEILQAIAYLVSSPHSMDAIEDKIVEAQEAEETEGVDLTLVRRAQLALERDESHRALVLLQRSIGAAADMAGSHMRPILQVPPGAETIPLATGEETGTSIVTEELAGRQDLTGTDLGLLGLAAALAAVGLLLSYRYRPAYSVHRSRIRAVR